MPKQRFDVEVPEGHHLGYSRGTDGARRAHLFRDHTNELAGHAELFAVAEDDGCDYFASPVSEAPRRTTEPHPFAEALTDAIVDWLSPYAEAVGARAGDALRNWWLDAAVPACKSTVWTAWRKVIDWHRADPQPETPNAAAPDAPESVPSSGELAAAVPVDGPVMSAHEAQGRLIASALAKAFSDEQLRLVLSAQIARCDDLVPGANSLETFTPEELEHRAHLLIKTSPSLLDEFLKTFLGLGSPTGQPVTSLEEAPPKLRLVAG